MEAVARAKYVRISPRKLRQVMALIRGKDVEEAFDILRFLPKKAARLIESALYSAVANAIQKQTNVERSDLYIKAIYADPGPIMKRWMPRAFGRASLIRKRTSHITIVIGYY